MKIGIIGLPQSGKSTVFQILVPNVPASADPTRPRVGITTVPDLRIDLAAGIFNPKKTTRATLEFIDFAGLSASTVAPMRTADALMAVVRFFGDATPAADFKKLMEELVLADLAIAEPRATRLAEDKKRGTKVDDRELAAVTKLTAVLSDGQPAFRAALTADESAVLRGFQLLTAKPFVVVANCDEAGFKSSSGPVAEALSAMAREYTGYQYLKLSAPVEEEIGQLEPEDRKAFLDDLGLAEPASHRIIRSAFRLLDLICFLTVGEDEVRAWPIRRGTSAQKAAGRIHSDLEKGFIRAEVSHWADFEKANGSAVELKKLGQLRLEGKEYEVQDGDVMNIRFAV